MTMTNSEAAAVPPLFPRPEFEAERQAHADRRRLELQSAVRKAANADANDFTSGDLTRNFQRRVQQSADAAEYDVDSQAEAAAATEATVPLSKRLWAVFHAAVDHAVPGVWGPPAAFNDAGWASMLPTARDRYLLLSAAVDWRVTSRRHRESRSKASAQQGAAPVPTYGSEHTSSSTSGVKSLRRQLKAVVDGYGDHVAAAATVACMTSRAPSSSSLEGNYPNAPRSNGSESDSALANLWAEVRTTGRFLSLALLTAPAPSLFGLSDFDAPHTSAGEALLALADEDGEALAHCHAVGTGYFWGLQLGFGVALACMYAARRGFSLRHHRRTFHRLQWELEGQVGDALRRAAALQQRPSSLSHPSALVGEASGGRTTKTAASGREQARSSSLTSSSGLPSAAVDKASTTAAICDALLYDLTPRDVWTRRALIHHAHWMQAINYVRKKKVHLFTGSQQDGTSRRGSGGSRTPGHHIGAHESDSVQALLLSTNTDCGFALLPAAADSGGGRSGTIDSLYAQQLQHSLRNAEGPVQRQPMPEAITSPVLEDVPAAALPSTCSTATEGAMTSSLAKETSPVPLTAGDSSKAVAAAEAAGALPPAVLVSSDSSIPPLLEKALVQEQMLLLLAASAPLPSVPHTESWRRDPVHRADAGLSKNSEPFRFFRENVAVRAGHGRDEHGLALHCQSHLAAFLWETALAPPPPPRSPWPRTALGVVSQWWITQARRLRALVFLRMPSAVLFTLASAMRAGWTQQAQALAPEPTTNTATASTPTAAGKSPFGLGHMPAVLWYMGIRGARITTYEERVDAHAAPRAQRAQAFALRPAFHYETSRFIPTTSIRRLFGANVLRRLVPRRLRQYLHDRTRAEDAMVGGEDPGGFYSRHRQRVAVAQQVRAKQRSAHDEAVTITATATATLGTAALPAPQTPSTPTADDAPTAEHPSADHVQKMRQYDEREQLQRWFGYHAYGWRDRVFWFREMLRAGSSGASGTEGATRSAFPPFMSVLLTHVLLPLWLTLLFLKLLVARARYRGLVADDDALLAMHADAMSILAAVDADKAQYRRAVVDCGLHRSVRHHFGGEDDLEEAYGDAEQQLSKGEPASAAPTPPPSIPLPPPAFGDGATDVFTADFFDPPVPTVLTATAPLAYDGALLAATDTRALTGAFARIAQLPSLSSVELTLLSRAQRLELLQFALKDQQRDGSGNGSSGGGTLRVDMRTNRIVYDDDDEDVDAQSSNDDLGFELGGVELGWIDGFLGAFMSPWVREVSAPAHVPPWVVEATLSGLAQ